MIQQYPLQVIAIDRVAAQAVELAELTHFEEVGEVLPTELEQKLISGYKQILVCSKITSKSVEAVAKQLEQMEDFIVLTSDTDEESEEIKQMVLLGARIFLASSDTVLSFSLSQILKKLETVFYPEDEENEIAVDHKDIYTVLGKGVLVDYYEESGSSSDTVMMRTLNAPKGMHDIYGVLTLFEIPENLPILEISEALDIMENLLPEEIDILFVTRNQTSAKREVRIGCFISRYINFQKELQKKITESETYLDKTVVIIEAFAQGIIDAEVAELLSNRNGLAFKDVNRIYALSYSDPSELVSLLRLLHNEHKTVLEKEEAIADLLLDTSIDENILEELSITHALSVERIIEIVKLKRDGKLIVHPVNVTESLTKEHPELLLAKSRDIYVLGNKAEFQKDQSGLLIVDSSLLTTFEVKKRIFYVDKTLPKEIVKDFWNSYWKRTAV